LLGGITPIVNVKNAKNSKKAKTDGKVASDWHVQGQELD